MQWESWWRITYSNGGTVSFYNLKEQPWEHQVHDVCGQRLRCPWESSHLHLAGPITYIQSIYRWYVWYLDTWSTYPYSTHQQHWKKFVNDLPFGELIWEDVELGKHLHFLDLWISIDTNNRIVTPRHIKKSSIYVNLYISIGSKNSLEASNFNHRSM